MNAPLVADIPNLSAVSLLDGIDTESVQRARIAAANADAATATMALRLRKSYGLVK